MNEEQRFFIDTIWTMIQLLEKKFPNCWGFKIKTATGELVNIPFSNFLTVTKLKEKEA